MRTGANIGEDVGALTGLLLLGSVLLVALLQSRNKVGLVASLGQALLGEELLQLRHPERRVFGSHGDRARSGFCRRQTRADVCERRQKITSSGKPYANVMASKKKKKKTEGGRGRKEVRR